MGISDHDMTVRISSGGVGRFSAFSVSLGLHAGLFVFLWLMPPLPREVWVGDEVDSKPLARALEDRRPRKVIWLRRHEKLPDISPGPKPAPAAESAQRKTALYVRATPLNAKHADQFIYLREPKIAEQRALPSPNFVMMDLPAAPAPPKPEQRRFVPPPQAPRQVRNPTLAEPEVNSSQDLRSLQSSPLTGALGAVPRPPSKKFVAPPEAPRQAPKALDLDEPAGMPAVAASVRNPNLVVGTGAMNGAPPPPRKKMGLPSSMTGNGSGAGGGRAAGSPSRIVEEPSVPTGGSASGIPGDISAVVISANPIPNGRIIPPEGNRAARIEAGAAGGEGKGSGTDSGGAGIVVPGLSVRGGGAASGSSSEPRNPAADAAMTPTRTNTRPRLDTPALSIPQWPNARRVPIQVESLFPGRVVYNTVIPGPSGTPDWILWFGEQQATPMGVRVIMRPPRLERLPATLQPARPNAAGKCWIRGRLNKEGRLASLEIAQGMGVDQVLELASGLQQSLWTPAIRNGDAVDVEVLMEVEIR